MMEILWVVRGCCTSIILINSLCNTVLTLCY